MRELTNFEKTVQSHITELLKDNLDDYKKVVKRLQATIALLIVLLFIGFIFYIWSFFSFVAQYDIESTITTTTSTDNNSKINNSQNANAQNNIKIDFPKVGGER